MSRKLLAALTLASVLGVGLGSARAAPLWPTLEKQLQKDRVIPGSALERLIRANQDFSILAKQGGRDQINVPLWLKVYWRKHHPEARYSPADPTGGYPMILEELYEWVLVHQNLQPGPAEADGPIEKVISESGEQRISGAQFNPHSESDIRVNYWNRNLIVGASNNISGSGAQAQFYSSNGGVSWGQTSLPIISGDVRHGDPAVDWTSDGTAWAATIGIDINGSILKMRSYRSSTGGASWAYDATFSGSQTNADKEMIWVDHSNSSSYKNNLYAIWHNNNPVYFSRRTGPSGSWSSPIQISGSETTGTGIGGDVKTNSSGDAFAFWPDTGSRGIYVTKSTNGGVSFGSRTRIATTYGSFKLGIPADNSRKPFIYVTAAAFRNPDKNRVFAAWMDLTGASGCTSLSNAPGANTASSCKTRIWFSNSLDGGTTWSAPRMINNQGSLNDQFSPWLVADDATGALAIIYYDTVADPGRKKTHVYYQSSFDDGQTWNPPFQVTTAQTDETAAGTDTGNQYGDYNSLSGYGALFFSSWTDRRSGGSEEIWSAAMSDPVPPGNPFVFGSIADQSQSCLGIASRNASYCTSIVNSDDRNLCAALAQGTQSPCGLISDLNLQLTCYGMSVKPSFPSNCRDVTDANLRNFCYGASGVSLTDLDVCRYITWRDTQLFCFAMNDNISSNCRDISDANERNFCYAVSAHDVSFCSLIQ
jgi:hypothetical protein